MRTLLFAAATLAGAVALHAQQAPLEQVVQTAAEKSSLALPGRAPFHLRASIADEKTSDPQWTASVEEWWQSPTEYRREFHSTQFSQVLITHGGKVEEHDDGPVFPELLRNLTTELTVTVPRYDQLAALHQVVDMPDNKPGQIVARWDIPGTDGTITKPIKASVAVSRQTGLFTYGGDLDWDVALHDFADFHGLQIARRLTAQSGRGPTLTARVTLLEDLGTPDEKLFHIAKATPPKQQLRVVVIPELEMRKLLVTSIKPEWPAATKPGAIVMRIVVDRTGQVRSVDDFYSDDPAAQPVAEAAVLQWRFRPYIDHGAPVQVISTVTLPLN
jgi:hypothetical protein